MPTQNLFLGALFVGTFVSSLLSYSQTTQAQITPDNTLNTENTEVRSVSSQEQIVEGGAIRGGNLFQSFEQFNVGENQTVNFANPESISNIFSRVTGSEISQILGNLGVLGEANLWLLNPNGFIFGENASLNLNGSFITTTAESINFANGTRFAANAAGEPLLTVSQPTALEFGNQPGTIINRAQSPRLAETNSQLNTFGLPAGLLVQPQQTLALIGGDVISEGGNLTAVGGNIEVGAVGANSLVGLDFSESGLTFDYQAVTDFADISLRDRDGEISFFSLDEQGQMILDSNNQPVINFASAQVASAVNASGPVFTSDGTSPIPNGSINFVGGNIQLLNGSQLLNPNFSDLPGGNITIQAQDQLVFEGSIVSGVRPLTSGVFTNTLGDGNAGIISIVTDNLILRDQATIASATSGIENPITGEVTLAQGEGGTIFIEATDSIVLEQGSIILSSSSNEGDAGDISIETNSLIIRDEAAISSSALNILDPITGEIIGVSQGEGGSISILATDSISLEQDAGILSNAVGEGNAGAINLRSQSLTLEENSEITATTDQSDGGNINLIIEDAIELREESQISTSVGGSGDGGNIDITTDFLLTSLEDNSDITASAELGTGGNIDIDAAGIFGIELQPALTEFSDITVSSEFGVDGTVTLSNPDVQLDNIESVDELLFATKPSAFIPNSCKAYLGNRYTITGRGGIPLAVRNTLRTEFGAEDWRIIEPNSTQKLIPFKPAIANKPTQKRTETVPTVQGWFINEQGEVVLTSEPIQATPQVASTHPGC